MPPFPNLYRIDLTFDLDFWSTDLSINKNHLHIKDYLPFKFDASWAKRSWVISCTRCGRPTDIPINWHEQSNITLLFQRITRCVCETLMFLSAKKSEKQFLHKGHNAINLGVNRKGIISGVCMPNMKSLFPRVQKWKLTTDKQTGQKQYASNPSIRGHKNLF